MRSEEPWSLRMEQKETFHYHHTHTCHFINVEMVPQSDQNDFSGTSSVSPICISRLLAQGSIFGGLPICTRK